jgi:hypothetical protein
MAVYDNLSGNGIQALSAGTTSLDLYMLTLPPNRTFGNAYPNNYYHMGLLRLGSYNNWLPAFPVDALNQHIEVPADVNQVSWAMVPNSAMRLTENITSLSIPNWQKQPWDRNATMWGNMFLSFIAGGTALTQAFTYTVPANRILRLSHLRALASRGQLATTPVVHVAQLVVAGIEVVGVYAQSNTSGYQYEDDLAGGPIECPAGTVITAQYQNQDVGGSWLTRFEAMGYTFDA